MRIIAIRQEGTEYTGKLLFVDLETQGRFGPIEVTFQLNVKNGDIILGYVEGKPLGRKATVEERRALLAAHKVHLDPQMSGFSGFPIDVTFEERATGITTVLS